MAISFTRYVNITSAVGGNGGVAQRQLIGRIFTTNHLVPTGGIIEFPNASSVGSYFGLASEEYKRALFYFGRISKVATAAKNLSFARWADTDQAPEIYGGEAETTLANWTGITTGDFTLTLGGVSHHLTALDFSGAASLAAVAGIIQTAIRSQTGTMWTAATVTYDATRKSFDLVGGSEIAANVLVVAGVTHDVSVLLGWSAGTGVILSNGVLEESLTTVLENSTAVSNNFGSFLFIGGSAFTTGQHLEVATWNAAQNVMFQYCAPVTAANAAAVSAAIISLAGSDMTLVGPSGEYHEMCPMIILASTNYEARNSTQNFMFQQFALTPTVTTDLNANTYDALRVNYYGVTQQAGQLVAFYQRGHMTGLATDPTDQNTYGNEQWLKDAAGVAIMSVFLALPKVSANATGRSQLLGSLQSVVDKGLFNGTFSVDKVLNETQKLYIGQLTGSDKAWYQVQSKGYWLDCAITSSVVNGVTEYKATYTLIYSKDDVIRYVEGSDILI